MKLGFALVNFPDCLYQIERLDVFEQIPLGTSTNGWEYLIVFAETGQDKHARLRIDLQDPAGGFHSIHLGHEQIQQDNVWIKTSRHLYRFPAVRSLAKDFHITLHLNEHSQALTHNSVVIDDQDADFSPDSRAKCFHTAIPP
jgi:hypothetical protein